MIFLTVGTTSFPFDRLFKGMDEALENLRSSEQLIAQIGSSNYHFSYKRLNLYTNLPFSKMIFYLAHARVVLAHGGFGTTILSLIHNLRKPILVPRIKQLGEHIDDHQTPFVELMVKRGLAEGIFADEDLVKKLELYLRRTGELIKPKMTSRINLTNSLVSYTEREVIK